MSRGDPSARSNATFYSTTTAEQLGLPLRFPLGHLKSKSETRESRVTIWDFSVADKPDSQDIVLCPMADYELP